MSSTNLQNRSFHDINRTTSHAKCIKMKNACAKHAKVKNLFMLSMRISSYDARGKFGEHERCIRVARGDS